MPLLAGLSARFCGKLGHKSFGNELQSRMPYADGFNLQERAVSNQER